MGDGGDVTVTNATVLVSILQRPVISDILFDPILSSQKI